MTTPDIIGKLREQIDGGISTEVQVVYLMAGIRKLSSATKRKTNTRY